MASITFTTEQPILDLFVEAACNLYKYPATVPDPDNPGATVANPQTPAQFAQQVIISFAKEVAKTYASQKAAEAARVQALADVEAAVNAATISVTTA